MINHLIKISIRDNKAKKYDSKTLYSTDTNAKYPTFLLVIMNSWNLNEKYFLKSTNIEKNVSPL